LLAAVALALYVTQLSRAGGVVVGSVAAVLVVAGVGITAARRGPPRAAVILFAIVVLGLAVTGALTWLVALRAEDRTGL
jgi:predicted small integral membrane protein